jgi:ankyrin repeat protein
MAKMYPRDMLEDENGNRPPVDAVLFRALAKKDYDTLRAHLAAGNTPDQVDDDNMSPLFLALKAKDITAIRILVEAGADVNEGAPYSCDSPLRLAIQNQCIETVKLLLECGADPGFISIGDSGDGPDGTKKREKPVSDIVVAKEGDPAIAAMVEAAFDKYRAVYEVSGNLLMRGSASYRGDIDAVRRLLQDGRPVDIKDENDRTALMYAVIDKDLPMVKMLLEEFKANPEVTMKDGETTALYFALGGRHPLPDPAIVKLLVQHGADPLRVSKDGKTMMHVAATSGDAETMKTLAALGVSLVALSKNGQSPVDAAREYGLKAEEVEPVMENVIDWWKQEVLSICQKATTLEQDVKPMKRLSLRARP